MEAYEPQEPDHANVTKSLMVEHMRKVMRVYGGSRANRKILRPNGLWNKEKAVNRSVNFNESSRSRFNTNDT